MRTEVNLQRRRGGGIIFKFNSSSVTEIIQHKKDIERSPKQRSDYEQTKMVDDLKTHKKGK